MKLEIQEVRRADTALDQTLNINFSFTGSVL